MNKSVYWYLRRANYDLFYFNENGNECDFVVLKNERILQVIQVCYELNLENRVREQNGLKAAMDFFRTDNGIIIILG